MEERQTLFIFKIKAPHQERIYIEKRNVHREDNWLLVFWITCAPYSLICRKILFDRSLRFAFFHSRFPSVLSCSRAVHTLIFVRLAIGAKAKSCRGRVLIVIACITLSVSVPSSSKTKKRAVEAHKLRTNNTYCRPKACP